MVVRSAIIVDPVTAQVTTVSDPLPQILEGIPLRLRSLLVNLDRPGFALNPTNCEPLSVDTSLVRRRRRPCRIDPASSRSRTAPTSSFGPKLGLKLKGSTKRRGHPALRRGLTDGAGRSEPRTDRRHDAEERAARQQPHRHRLHPSPVRGRLHARPTRSTARRRSTTPLLDQPLSGPVYLRSSTTKLPDLVADLQGQFDIELAGKIDTAKRRRPAGHLQHGAGRAGLEVRPRTCQGGKKGLLVNSKSLCKGDRKAKVQMTGQNGRIRQRQGQAAELRAARRRRDTSATREGRCARRWGPRERAENDDRHRSTRGRGSEVDPDPDRNRDGALRPACSSRSAPRARRPSTNTSTRANSSTAAARRKASSSNLPGSTTSRRPKSCTSASPVRRGSSRSSTRTVPRRTSAPSTTEPVATTSTSANRVAEKSRSTRRTTRPPKATSTSVGESCSVTTRTDCRSNPRSMKPSSAKRASRVVATFSPAAGPPGRTANSGISHRATGSPKSTSAISKPSKRKKPF